MKQQSFQTVLLSLILFFCLFVTSLLTLVLHYLLQLASLFGSNDFHLLVFWETFQSFSKIDVKKTSKNLIKPYKLLHIKKCKNRQLEA